MSHSSSPDGRRPFSDRKPAPQNGGLSDPSAPRPAPTIINPPTDLDDFAVRLDNLHEEYKKTAKTHREVQHTRAIEGMVLARWAAENLRGWDLLRERAQKFTTFELSQGDVAYAAMLIMVGRSDESGRNSASKYGRVVTSLLKTCSTQTEARERLRSEKIEGLAAKAVTRPRAQRKANASAHDSQKGSLEEIFPDEGEEFAPLEVVEKCYVPLFADHEVEGKFRCPSSDFEALRDFFDMKTLVTCMIRIEADGRNIRIGAVHTRDLSVK